MAARRGSEEVPRLHGILISPAYIGSPMQEVREHGRAVRYRMKDLPARPIM